MTQQLAKRWFVELQGKPSELEALANWFPDGDAYVAKEEDRYFVTGSTLQQLDDPNRVREEVVDIVDGFVAVALLLRRHFNRPSLGSIFSEDYAGNRRQHAFVVGAEFIVRTDLLGAIDTSRPTEAQRLLIGAHSDSRLKDAVMVWADPVRTWPRLHRVLEEIEERFLKTTVDKAGWSSHNERSRFTRSSQCPEVAGKDARHRSGKFVPPENPMRLEEATKFVGSQLMRALHRANSDRASGQRRESASIEHTERHRSATTDDTSAAEGQSEIRPQALGPKSPVE